MNRTSRFACIPSTRWVAAENPRFMKRLIVGVATTVLLGGGVAGVVGVSAGTAQAKPGPVPLDNHAWPGCPDASPAGPCHTGAHGTPRCRPVIFVWTRSFGTRLSATPTGMSGLGRGMLLISFLRAIVRRRRHRHRWALISAQSRPGVRDWLSRPDRWPGTAAVVTATEPASPDSGSRCAAVYRNHSPDHGVAARVRPPAMATR